MPGNSFGQLFRITTFGESHGPAIGVVIDGVPPRIPLTLVDIQTELDRRKPGQSSITTSRKESDQVEIISGCFENQTTGTPLTLLVRNHDQKSSDYSQIKDIFRPGHADYTYSAKYGIRDYRGGGRASGRETVARVAAGAVAKIILAQHRISITGYTLSIGPIHASTIDFSVIEKNPVRCADLEAAKKMVQAIENAQKENDSLGGIVEVVIKGAPAGLGDPVFEKLDALIGSALFSIGAIKGVEFGAGFELAAMRGSEANDAIYTENNQVKMHTNHVGGILGGISSGQDLVVRCAVKPTPSINISGRHDPCICPRIVPVVESMVAIVLVDRLLIQTALSQN